MKKNLLTLFSLLTISGISVGQTTALDWTKDDCNGVSHNLYSELEDGQVIICEYVMQCATCISAAYYLNEIYLDYEGTNPGQVKYYAIDWKEEFTCDIFQTWAADLSCTLFLNGYDEVLYYGGMGMPTVVVLGDADHTVYYSKLGYDNNKDNAAIREAIDAALSATSIDESDLNLSSINVFPNPSTEFINLSYSLKEASPVTMEVYNVIGEKVDGKNFNMQPAGKNQYTLATQDLNPGFYLLKINTTVDSKSVVFSVIN